jgi:predicted transcriptional regulator
MIVAMAMATGLTAGAAEAKTNLFNMTQIERYQLNVNNKRIAKTLELTNAQTASLEFLHNRMNERLIKIYEAGGNEEAVRQEVESESRMLSNWLDKRQYSKYVKLLNATFQNRGFDFTIPCEWRKR